MSPRLVPAAVALILAGGLAALGAVEPAPSPPTRGAVDPAPSATLPTCSAAPSATSPPPVDATLRDSAQRGLRFLERSTVDWQARNACYGCHVQAVTMTALAVGERHDYDVDAESMAVIARGLTELDGGSRTGGLRYGSGTFLSASKSLGGAAFARYDAWVGTSLRDDLLQTATELLSLQDDSGAIRNDYTSEPVAIGPIQDTVLAMVTWNQAHARTADDQWLTAVARAEDWLHGQVASFRDAPPTSIQPINYALLGLAAAQSGTSETATAGLVAALTGRQNDDGGWSLHQGSAGARSGSDAYATGQTLYTLRSLGFTDADPSVARGSAWLLAHQGEDGGWSRRGSERAEAMWAVLGLVSVDVLSLAVRSLEDGAHVHGVQRVDAEARDNQGGAVVEIELRVDDVPVHRACGATLATDWDTSGLATGPHLVDLVARNAEGRTARRRLTVYAGDHWLTRVGTRYEDDGTVVSVRNLAPTERDDQVRLTVLAATTVDGVDAPGRPVFTDTRDGAQGAMRFFWDGDGGDQPEGRYFARLEYLGADDRALQRVEVPFVHATVEVQAARFAEVGGQLRLAGADGANTRIDLVDDLGNVLQSTITTASGQYRFKGVREGSYKVRVAKDGWGAEEAEVRAAPASKAEGVDLAL